jgi:4-diphosphocytidyl-2-C-methyl-D-erythritol kinase
MLIDRARAKINLTLQIEGRRPDGWHALESLVCFAGKSDALTLAPGEALSLSVDGPTAMAAGDGDDNLVLRAARHLAGLVPGLTTGAFHLTKRLPVAAGVGGGSADAAAALRLLAQANWLSIEDERVMAAARATGADVPVCVGSKARMMRGIGEMRVKESDRIALMANGLKACGVDIEEEPEGMIVHGSGQPPKGAARIRTNGDHRIAMSHLVLGLAAQTAVTVDEPEMIATSFPTFHSLMAGLGADISA